MPRTRQMPVLWEEIKLARVKRSWLRSLSWNDSLYLVIFDLFSFLSLSLLSLSLSHSLSSLSLSLFSLPPHLLLLTIALKASAVRKARRTVGGAPILAKSTIEMLGLSSCSASDW